MDIMNVSSALSAVQNYDNLGSVASQASVAMLDKSLDMSAQMGDGMIKMMENSVNPHIGGNFDFSV